MNIQNKLRIALPSKGRLRTDMESLFEEKKIIFKDYKSYEKYFKKQGVLVDHDKRKKLIKKEFSKILRKKKLTIEDNSKLLNEVINLVDNPNVLLCSFDKILLSIFRCAIYEIEVKKEISKKIVISEYLLISNQFFGNKEATLLNGVLDNLR